MSEDYQNRVVHSVQWRFDPITGEPLSAALVPLTQRPAAQTEREAFEEWWESDGPNTSSPYEAAMSAWEAGRASLPAPQQATPEPVGEVVAYREKLTGRLCDPEDTHRRKFPMCYEPLTRPAPGVPEDVHTGDDLPPAGKFVIAWVEGLKAPLRAMWVPDFHLPANEDADPDWAKYSEEHDAYFAPSGWYECNHCDETNWQIHERVLAWSHLPVIDRAALAAAQAKGGGQ